MGTNQKETLVMTAKLRLTFEFESWHSQEFEQQFSEQTELW